VKNKEVDEALTAVKNTVDFNVVLGAMDTFQKVYMDKTIEVPLYFRKEVYLKSPALQNFTGNPTSTGPMWNVQHWYFSE
jgi:ABC-type transport system substrate-binding protein